ncbi:hypothetical protein ACOMHN_031484 [Nucella lapillus]
MGIDAAARKKALLLHYAGEEVFDIFQTFSEEQIGPATQEGYNTLCASLTAHFEPKKNIDYETFKFRQSKQEPSETIDTFCIRLRRLAATCDFPNVEREIKSQILQGCYSQRLSRRALRDDLNLDNLLKAARALEISDEQAEAMEVDAKSTVNAIGRRPASRGRGVHHGPLQRYQQHQHPPQRQYQRSYDNRLCGWCGGQRHPREKCPAKDKVCKNCTKHGHFVKVCRSGEGRGTRRPYHKNAASIKTITHDVEDDSDASDEEYVFGVKGNIKTPYVDLELAGESVPFLIDTGASVNVIDEHSHKNILNTCTLTPSSTHIFSYGNKNPLHVVGQFDTKITHKDTSVRATFHVVRSQASMKYGNLLSAKTAEKLNIVSFAFATNTLTVADALCNKSPSLFKGIGKLKDVKVTLYQDPSVQPVAQPHRRIPFHLRKQVEEEIQRLEDLDIIEKVDGPTPWISPIVVVPKPKKPGQIRLCVDMRVPNQAIKRTRHIMPTLDDILMCLNQATVFSKLDLNQAAT